jgi:hypothetical protein
VNIFSISVIVLLLQTSVHAADRIRIVIPGVGATFMTFPLAQKRGFLKTRELTPRSSGSPVEHPVWH